MSGQTQMPGASAGVGAMDRSIKGQKETAGHPGRGATWGFQSLGSTPNSSMDDQFSIEMYWNNHGDLGSSKYNGFRFRDVTETMDMMGIGLGE